LFTLSIEINYFYPLSFCFSFDFFFWNSFAYFTFFVTIFLIILLKSSLFTCWSMVGVIHFSLPNSSLFSFFLFTINLLSFIFTFLCHWFYLFSGTILYFILLQTFLFITWLLTLFFYKPYLIEFCVFTWTDLFHYILFFSLKTILLVLLVLFSFGQFVYCSLSMLLCYFYLIFLGSLSISFSDI
jgi:hypothetical protein